MATLNYNRIVHMGLYSKAAQDLFDSIFGQLSDGIWENAWSSTKYWYFAQTDRAPDGEVVIKVAVDYSTSYCGRYVPNGFREMSDVKILEWLGFKLKAIVQTELRDNDIKKGWKRDSEFVSQYLTRSQDLQLTVGDAYYVYDILRGRDRKSINAKIDGVVRDKKATKQADNAKKRIEKLNDDYLKYCAELRKQENDAIMQIKTKFDNVRSVRWTQVRKAIAEQEAKLAV